MMLEFLKRLVASKEMAELERWRVEWNEHRRWLAEFPLVGMALDNMRAEVEGNSKEFISDLRDKMRGIDNADKMLEWLQERAEEGCVTLCFEMDGGMHVTLDPCGGEQRAARYVISIREGIASLMAAPNASFSGGPSGPSAASDSCTPGGDK